MAHSLIFRCEKKRFLGTPGASPRMGCVSITTLRRLPWLHAPRWKAPNLNCGATRRPFGLCVWGTARWPTLLRPNDSARYSVPGAVHSLSAALRQSAPTTPQVTVFNAIISGLKSFLCVTIMTGAVRY
jgi:hypothetical protein